LLVARERATHNEQLARLGAGLAHETKNPLSLVRGMAQSLLDDAGDGQAVYDRANRIIDETDRIVGQINGFLTLARPKTPALEPVALDPLFSGLASLIEQEARENGVAVEVEGAGRSVEADPELLRRALLNLLLNALQACGAGDHVRLFADGARIVVEDSGPGIAPEDIERVMEPYFSKRPGGTGLGLAIVEEIARLHGWRCTLVSAPGRSTRVALEGARNLEAQHD
jgi:signal transduction histidine kinase